MPNQKYEAFVTVAKTGSFKKTAEILGYTQAGVSYMMSSLEQEMGTALFTRDHSGARLTADGRNLLPWIQDVCASEQALQTRLEELRSVEYDASPPSAALPCSGFPASWKCFSMTIPI